MTKCDVTVFKKGPFFPGSGENQLNSKLGNYYPYFISQSNDRRERFR